MIMYRSVVVLRSVVRGSRGELAAAAARASAGAAAGARPGAMWTSAVAVHRHEAAGRGLVHTSTARSRADVDASGSDPDFLPQKRTSSQADSGSAIEDRIRADLERDAVVLYMKGLPSQPQCGFSLRTVQILRAVGVQFRAFNVLANQDLREGIKRFSSWPTIPQLFVKGEFVGGCDIVEEMYRDGSLAKLFTDSGAVMPSQDEKEAPAK